jgi:hypothetical protein
VEETKAVAKVDGSQYGGLFKFKSASEAFEVAEKISKSELIPTAYRGKPIDIVIAWEFGADLGLSPLQALKSVCVINGSPTVWGDAALAIVIPKTDYEYCKETFDEKTMTATCETKRKGEPAKTATFSQKDAETAGLWGSNTWKKYPKRMLQMRARGFALRDTFPHHLRGIYLTEEMTSESNAIDGGEVIPEPVQKKALLPLGDDLLDDTPETPKEPEPVVTEPIMSEEDKKALWVLAKENGAKSKEDVLSFAMTALGHPAGSDFNLSEMTVAQFEEVKKFYQEQG